MKQYQELIHPVGSEGRKLLKKRGLKKRRVTKSALAMMKM